MQILITLPDYESGPEERQRVLETFRALFSEFPEAEVELLAELEMLVIANGNAFDGITLEGPFFDNDEAALHAESTSDGEWHVVKVNKPEV